MSVKHSILAVLHDGERYGYQLRAEFEERTGATWPLNIGQVYTALSRLEKDGLVECQVVPQDLLPDRKVYGLTDRGRTELRDWLDHPDTGPVSLRDSFFLKIALASLNGQGTQQLIHRQREEHLSALAELGRLQGEPKLNPATELLLEGAMLRLEADLKWLDVCEERLKA